MIANKDHNFKFSISYYEQTLGENTVLLTELTDAVPEVGDYILIDRKIFHIEKRCWIAVQPLGVTLRGIMIIVKECADIDLGITEVDASWISLSNALPSYFKVEFKDVFGKTYKGNYSKTEGVFYAYDVSDPILNVTHWRLQQGPIEIKQQ